MTRPARKFRLWWLAVPVACGVICAAPFGCRPDPEKLLAAVPIGSSLEVLDEKLAHHFADSTVFQTLTTEGVTTHEDLGPFNLWVPTKPERDTFTGEITFIHRSWVIPDDLAPSYIFSFTYANGVLKDKTYGILPG
jgi:hypothetical protein